MASSSGGAEVKEVIYCINCRQQIQLRLHVKCCECPAMICAECFSYGCEAGQHVRGHNYEICDPLGGRTFDVKGSWGAIEERKLLAAAYRFKLGNWGEVTRLMETERSISQVQEYYDRFFIRGPIGQFALKLLNWEESKRAMLADGSLAYNCEDDRITYLLMAMDAYKESKEKLDPCDEDLTNKMDAIMQNYLFRLNLNDERPQCNDQSELSELVDLALSDDSCDPSDYDMDKKAPDDAYSTGLEPENDSEEDDGNNHSASPSKSTKADPKPSRKSSRPSVVFMRPAKKKIRCGLRKSTLEKNGRASRYRRVQAESSSTEDDSGSEDEVEPMETDQASVDDTQDSMHGLEKEDTTDECTGSDSEDPKQEPAKKSATPTSSAVRKRRRAKVVSKKARRLKEFQKRMARMTKAAERRLNELSELCPLETIRDLRNSRPDLALYTNDYVGRPKVRQSDMDMLAYNAARGDFEWEWYNDAEQLISRLMIQESSDKVEDLENDIKFARIERYYRILKTRKAYRRAIVEHDKISEFFRFMMNMTMEKRKASQILSQRPPLEKLLTRAQQCLTKKETEDLRTHVEKADELMDRIAKLQELQRNGVLTLKEAVLLVVALCWTRFLMDSLPSLLFLSTIVELYYINVLAWTLFLKKLSRCYGSRNAQSRRGLLSCSLQFNIEELMLVEEVVVDNLEGQLSSPLLSLKFRSPRSGTATPLRRFRHRGRFVGHNNGGAMEDSQQGSSGDMSSSSQSSGSCPVNVDAVLGANTVEDIADTHPDFARLLLDCYSAGCDLEEYKREFQRLKNLRIKRQGGVNQTLSFSLFPSVPSDLPGHLFVRLLKFHSLYEGACRKYLADVVNRRVEASPSFPYDLSTVGIQDLIQGGSSTEYYSAASGSQSVAGSYAGSDAHFLDPSDVAQGTSSAVAYSPARHMTTPISGMESGQSYSNMSAPHSQHYQQMPSSSGMHGMDNRRMMTSTPMIGGVDSSAQASPFATPTKKPRARRKPVAAPQAQVQGQQSMIQSRQMTATPVPGWQQHQAQSNMAMQGQPLHVQNRTLMSASVTPLQRQLTTPVPDHREMMSATPLPGWAPHQVGSGNNQVERSPLVSSLPPLSQFTPIQQPQARQMKTPYPPSQSRQLVTPVAHTQQRAMSTIPYEQSSHVYPQSREMMTPVPFAQPESVNVPYAQSQNIGTQMGSTTGEMYPQQSIQYQWSEGSSMDVYGQQGQFVQQPSYGQQSQFNQQMNSGSQQQFAGQYSQLIPTYSTQPACGIQNAQLTPGSLQTHQMPRSCDVAGAVHPQHGSDIAHQDQQSAANFASGMMDMGVSSNTGAIVDLLQSNDPLASGETLDVVQSDYPGMASASIPSAPMIDPMLDGQIRTFDITQCPPPPRNDSEATVPARTSPNSCSPGLAGDDDASSLIPSFFYPKEFVQNDLNDLRIEDSPIEKGLVNCQHFRFDIILAMKHHRIGKEDYERTLHELDEMEKEKCVGPLGDLLMKRLGLKRQEQYSHDGKFSVDELVAAFAANATIQESGAKMPERRMSSELFSEFLDDITPMQPNTSADQFHIQTHPDLHPVSPAAAPPPSLSKSTVLQSGDAMNDLGYLLSDDVIAEFDSMSSSAPAAVKPASVGAPTPLERSEPLSVGAPASFARSEPLSVGSPAIRRDVLFDKPGVSADTSILLTPDLIEGKVSAETFAQNDMSNAVLTSSSSNVKSVQCGQPAAPAGDPFSPSDLATRGNSTKESLSKTLSSQPEEQMPSTVKVNTIFSGKVAPRKPFPENESTPKKSLEIGAPAQSARRSDAFANESYGNLSPFVISPEPLSDEEEWWRKDDETPPMLGGTPLKIKSDAIDLKTSILERTLENSKPLDFEMQSSSATELEVSAKAAVTVTKRSPKRSEEKETKKEMDRFLQSPSSSHPMRLKTSDEDEDERKSKVAEHVKKPPRKTNRILFGSDSSSEDSAKEDALIAPSTSRAHQSVSLPSLPLVSRKKSHSPHDHHSPRSGKKKGRKSSLPSRPTKESKEAVQKSGLSKVELSREVLAKQIAEIIEDERSKLPPEEAKFHKRPLSPASLDVVIQDLMQHHISEDTSPNRELFASKLLGTDIFSKLFFRAGKCVFRHYEELDDFRSKEKGRGRRKGAARKRDTELLRGIRKSREIQKYKDALRAAKEPSEAEKRAAVERAKLEAMPWLARSTFKPDVQQGTSSRFVIPKKSSGNRSGGESTTSRATSETKQETSRQVDVDVKSSHHKVEERASEHHKSGSSNDKGSLSRRSRSPPPHLVGIKSVPRIHEERLAKVESPVSRKVAEVSASFSFYWMPRSHKAKAKHTWPLKRWRSASAVIEEAVEVLPDSALEEHPEDDSVFEDVMEDVDIAVDSFAEVRFEKPPTSMESSNAFPTTSFVSARESELAALALQEEMSRSEQGSPDDQYDALRYLAAMPESEFSGHSDTYEPSTSVKVAKKSSAPKNLSAVLEVPTKVLPVEQLRREEAHFEQADWIRMDPITQPFYGTEFDNDPWRLPSSSAPALTSRQPTETVQTADAVPGGNSLYSSLQEELDTIVRDTLGDTLYSPTAIGGALPITTKPAVEKFQWPKADVPVRSYALDTILPPLMCDKSKIAMLDMCRCQRCTTRCEYFCDHEEWKYLYECAIACRKEREEAERRRLPPPDRVCSETFELSKKSEKKSAKSVWKVWRRTSDRGQLSIIRAPSNTSVFTRKPAAESAQDRRWIYQRTSAAQKFTSVSAKREYCELKRLPCLENLVVLREELQFCEDRESFSSFASPTVTVLRHENEAQASAQAIMPIYQVSYEKTAMSIFSAPVGIDLYKDGSSIEYKTSVPIPRTEIFGTEVADLSVSYEQEDDALSARATINVPRKTSALLNSTSHSIALSDPQWIVQRSVCSSEISLPYPRHDATILSSRQSNVERRRADVSLSTSVKLPIPRITKSSFAYSYVDEGLQASEPSVQAEISLPLPVSDVTFYRSSQLRVRRKRAGATASTDIVLPIPRSEAFILSVYELGTDQKREDSQAAVDFSVPLPREESTILNITEVKFHRRRQDFADITTGAMPIARMEYTTTNILKLTVKRKRVGFAAASDAVITIPRVCLAAFSATEAEFAHIREDSLGCSEKVVPIPREESTILNSLTLRVKRTKKPIMEPIHYSHPIPREEDAKFAVYDLTARRLRASDEKELCYAHPIPRVSQTVCTITARSFDMVNREVYVFDSNKVMNIAAEEDTSTHIIDMNIHRLRKEQLSVVQQVTNYSAWDQYALATHSRKDSFENELTSDDVSKSSTTIVPIPLEDVEVLRLSTIRMSRKRKHEEESTLLVKRIKIEDRAGLFITDKSFTSDANRITEVVYVKDPRLPLQCSNSFIALSIKWRYFAHQHMPHLVFSSYLTTQFATLLQRVFAGGVDRCTITINDLNKLFANMDGRYDLSVFTDPNKVMATCSDPSGPIWNRLMKLRMQRNSTELLNRKALAPLYIFLGMTNLPRVGKPWRKWLKPLDATTESRIGCQLALCMRIPDIVGVDDMDPKLQAIKMWWTFMMIRGTLPWYIYPCFSRRQLFLLVRLLEALEEVERPPFCLYPPKVFFKAVKKVLRHARMDLIPKDIYHPDITTMATLLKLKRNRVFHVDRSLPELLSHWMDDMNKIDVYLAADVKLNTMNSSSFLTQSEWAWMNFGQGCVPDGIKYDRNVKVEATIEQLTECLADVNLPLEQRKQISVLRTALGAWAKYDSGPSIDQIPVDIINPFALSASLIALLPMPEGFVDECFTFLEKVSKKSSQLRQNPVKRSTKNSLNWKWKPSERLAAVGKPTSAGTKANGRTTISTLFEEFWRSPKDFSTISVFNKEESMTSYSPNYKNTQVSADKTPDELATKSSTPPSKLVREMAKPPSSHGDVKGSKSTKRLRKRKDLAVGEAKSASEIMRPFKRSKLEMRKRRRARTSDEDGPTSAKQPMAKIPDYRSSKLRHTLARRGMETEKMVHETVLRAAAIAAVQGSDAPIPCRKSVKRPAREYSSSDDSEVVRPTKPIRVKRSRPATIFDVTNFEWVLEMSLRRPRAFVGLYKTMKCQYRVLEKRRWVEKNRKLYDRAQFEKFLKETSHSEVEMIEKTKLLKAEKDMELALGIKRAEAERMAKFAVKDLAHWYGMSARYAVQADALAKKTLEEAKMLDVALERLKKQEEEAEKERQRAGKELAIENSVSATLNSIVQTIQANEDHEIENELMEVADVKKTLMDMIVRVEKVGADERKHHPKSETTELRLPKISEFDADASKTATFVPMFIDDVKDDQIGYDASQNSAFGSIICMDRLDKEFSKLSDNRIPPIIHIQSHIPITSAFISLILKMNIHFKPQFPFEPRFKRPRRVDREQDLLPPGDFSPYSTDEEWEEYYEKKERFENHHPTMHQLSWSSYGRDEEDDDECISGPEGHHHCDCVVASDRAKDWVSNLATKLTRRCYSEEVLPSSGLSVSVHRNLIRCRSALSCLSLEQLPILEAPKSDSSPKVAEEKSGKHRERSSSLSLLVSKSHSSSHKRHASVPRSWKPAKHWVRDDVLPSSLSESRRERYMYPRALYGYRCHVYGCAELPSAESRRNRRRGHHETDIPDQWIKRDEKRRYDFLKTARFWLEDRTQRNIPVVWCARPDRCESQLSQQDDFDMEKEDQYGEVIPATELRECPLKYPIAVYNPPPTWNMPMQLPHNEKRTEGSSERLEQSSSEPSAFQPVLQRPQPIDLNAIELDMQSDDESDDKMPNWPLLKKLRDAERELLAAGNPIAIERQKMREYNRQLRSEMALEQSLLEEQMRQMNQLYLEYLAAQQLILVQGVPGGIQTGEGVAIDDSALNLPLVNEQDQVIPIPDCNQGESLIEVSHLESDEVNREVLNAASSEVDKDVLVQVEDVPMQVDDDSECSPKPDVLTSGDGSGDSTSGVEQGSVELAAVVDPLVAVTSSPSIVVTPSPGGQTRVSSGMEKSSGGGGSQSSPEL
ncbi:hypothetical protein OSTOST_01003 [Ostertagia ostertagi]